MMLKRLFYIFIIILLAKQAAAIPFDHLRIETSTGIFNAYRTTDSVYTVSFLVTESQEIIHIRGRLSSGVQNIVLLTSSEYEFVDSLIVSDDEFFATIKFRDVIASRFLKLIFKIDGMVETVDLEPYSDAIVEIRSFSDKLIVGEQKEFELFSSISNNILASKRWEETPDYDYYISIRNGVPMLSILPKSLGPISCTFNINLRQPVRNGDIATRMLTISARYTVEKSSIVFINFDMSEYVLTSDARTSGIKTLIDNNIVFKQAYTYRITDAEDNSGVLIGEIFIPKRINRGKAEAILRLYNYHDRKTGYLYIKDVEETVFITNFTVRPETSIQNVFIQRIDGVWRLENTVFPGETVRIKLEGTSLLGEPVVFDGGAKASLDTLLSDDNKLIYTVYIPKDVYAQKQEILMTKAPSGRFLEVVEKQIPRNFDFISINYGDGKKRVSDIEKPLMCRKNIDYFSLTFNENKIDESAELHGKQYVNIKVSMFDKNKKLIENTEIGSVCVCPGDNSVRSSHYDKIDCTQELIELNNYLFNHTANLDDWSSVVVEFRHVAEKYDEPPLSHKIEVVLSRKVNYDLDLSFPAGLLTKEFGHSTQELNNFSGISLAMVAQLSFYQKNKIAKYRPYKIGVGFLAFNMFSMSAEIDERDLGIVFLTSIYPSTTDRRLSFPLFLGAGYFLSKERFFMLVGPGIRISI